MNKSVKILAVALPLILLAPGCQKETLNENTKEQFQLSELKKVHYSVDGNNMTTLVTNDASWKQFLQQMMALAEEGHQVRFRLDTNSVTVNATKEKLTYTTTSQIDAQNWCDQKAKDGYEVSVDYDPITKIYTCTAIK